MEYKTAITQDFVINNTEIGEIKLTNRQIVTKWQTSVTL